MDGDHAVLVSTLSGVDTMSSLSPPNSGRPVEDDASPFDETPWPAIDWTTPPLIQGGLDAYHRDLPELLEKHQGRWAAYSGDRRLGITRTKDQAFQLGVREGLTGRQFVVVGIDPSHLDDMYWEEPGDE